jgi:CHAT domain-containing protein/Tfp pilus assembly protein PilF
LPGFTALLVILTLTHCSNVLGKSSFAEPQLQQLLEAKRLNREIEALSAERKYVEAIPRAERLVSILEQALGPEDIAVARLLNNLAGFYRQTGNYAAAELRYKRSLAIAEKRLGATHQIVSLCLGNLASLYSLMGNYVLAEEFYKRVLTIAERTAGGGASANLAEVLNSLAIFYSEKGDDDQAEQLLQRSLTMAEQLPNDTANRAAALNSLGFVHLRRMDYIGAQALFRRAVSLTESMADDRDRQVLASSLEGVARIYEEQGNFKLAQGFYERALEIAENTGRDDPSIATTLNNLALVYMEQGDNKRAQPILERALADYEKRYGRNSIHLVSSLVNLSHIYEGNGDTQRAVSLLVRSFDIRERTLRFVLASGSERQKRLYLATLSRETDGIISMMVQDHLKNKELIDLALTSVLRRKGRALDAMSDQIAILRKRASFQDIALLDELSVAKGQLANILLGSSPDREDTQALTATLERRIEELEENVGAHSDEFRQRLQVVTPDRVRVQIPPGAALVEIFKYHPFDAKAITQAGKFGEPRYIAFVLRREGETAWVELGDANLIDRGVSRFRAALKNTKSLDADKLGRSLDEQIMQPIRPLVADSRQILLSPDGGLNLIPFGALVDEQSHYLIENYSITYLTSGRDLLRSTSAVNRPKRSLVIANPLFDESATNRQSSATATATRSIDFTKFKYDPLPNTALEAKEIARILTDARVLTEGEATEGALKQSSAPRILHIATHGFFLEDQIATASGERSLVRERLEQSSENPLLRSGLILAGVTQRNSGAGEDGVLSALEAATLDLKGTQLVVLSACETGIGDVRIGDGVFGLRRSLVLAGAESQVTSLWQVDDKATRDLMVDFYTRLQSGEGRGEALRNAELATMRTAGRGHPYYWAAFIEVGDWRSLDRN